jgi:hypothetical protein
VFDDLIYEFKMHRVLKKLARQRVAMILEPGNVPVVERAIGRNEQTKAFLLTAQIRGWVDILHEDMLTGKLDDNRGINTEQPFQSKENHWKLTDSGWGAIQRRHQLSILNLSIAVIGTFVVINV